MPVIKVYDAVCYDCGNWYGSRFSQPRVSSSEEAMKEMKQNGWVVTRLCNYCDECRERI